jgi:predicted signal transduction protein with EAL and GGDEF domain
LADHLVKNADIAMYHAKNNGGSQFRSYTRGLNVEFEQKVEMEASLRKSLHRKDFRLVYQPQVDINLGKMTGTEALIRWNTTEWGDLSPDQFIQPDFVAMVEEILRSTSLKPSKLCLEITESVFVSNFKSP